MLNIKKTEIPANVIFFLPFQYLKKVQKGTEKGAKISCSSVTRTLNKSNFSFGITKIFAHFLNFDANRKSWLLVFTGKLELDHIKQFERTSKTQINLFSNFFRITNVLSRRTVSQMQYRRFPSYK